MSDANSVASLSDDEPLIIRRNRRLQREARQEVINGRNRRNRERRARKQSTRAKNKAYGRRAAKDLVRGAHACRRCFGSVHDGAQPNLGRPIQVVCVMEKAGASSCNKCQKGKKTCEPVSTIVSVLCQYSC